MAEIALSIGTGLVANALTAIGEWSHTKLERNQKILRALNKLGLLELKPSADAASCE